MSDRVNTAFSANPRRAPVSQAPWVSLPWDPGPGEGFGPVTPGTEDLRLFVGVLTAAKSAEKRKAVRKTWGADPRLATVKFFVSVDNKTSGVAEALNAMGHKIERPQLPIGGAQAIWIDGRTGVLIGASGQPQQFTSPVIEALGRNAARPIVFALSNPTSKAECTAEQAYAWSRGRAIFASGSPFDPVELEGTTFVPGQGNNAYVFPGVGLGAIVSQARAITDEMFLAAALSLAHQVSDADLARGRIYPSLQRIREVSALIARDVAKIAYERGIAGKDEPGDILADTHEYMYQPVYPHYA